MSILKLNKHNSFLLLLVTGILIEVFYTFFVLNNGAGDISLYMFTYFEVFILFLFAFYVIRISNPETGLSSFSLLKIFTGDKSESPKFILPVIIILFGILFRLTLIPAAPTTSPDVYRYVWDGKVIYNGYNPYQFSPDADNLKYLRDDVYNKIHFNNIPSIYPPASQLVFLLGYTLSGNNLIGLKLIFLLCEIITMIFLVKLLYLKKKNPNFIILYAWLPLPLMEYFVNAHIDVAGIMFLVLFIYFLEKENLTASVIFFSLSFLIKLYPVFLIPLLVRRMNIRRFIYFISVFIVISVIFYSPFINGSFSVADALMIYINKWEFNASVYYILTAFIQNHEIARIICGIFLILSIVCIAIYYKDIIKGIFGVLLAVIIFSPVLYPWYLGWISALNPFAVFYSVLSILFTINLSNFSPLGKVWHEYFPVLFTEYAIFFVFLAYDLFHQKTKKTLPDILK